MDSSEIVDFSNINLWVYKRIKIDKIIYTSLLYTRPRKSIDYFIGLKNGIVGMAKFYFEHKEEIYVMVDEFEIFGNIYHISKVLKTKRIIMAPISEIEKKHIFMKVGINEFIVLPPNPYENE
jgi:hypothetical protein